MGRTMTSINRHFRNEHNISNINTSNTESIVVRSILDKDKNQTLNLIIEEARHINIPQLTDDDVEDLVEVVYKGMLLETVLEEENESLISPERIVTSDYNTESQKEASEQEILLQPINRENLSYDKIARARKWLEEYEAEKDKEIIMPKIEKKERKMLQHGCNSLFKNELLPIIQEYTPNDEDLMNKNEQAWMMFVGALEHCMKEIRKYILSKLNKPLTSMY